MKNEVLLTTDDFQLTISVAKTPLAQRLSTYQTTLLRKAQQGDIYSPITLTHENANGSFELQQPFFFENTDYQFEWLFFADVTDGEIAHRNQSICEPFHFKKGRNGIPARLTGNLNTRNNVGQLRLPLRYKKDGKLITQAFLFDVLPTKMLLHDDLPTMYEAIDSAFPLWRFSLAGQTDQSASKSAHRGSFELMWLASFEALRERFEYSLKVIAAAPHKRLQAATHHYKADRLKGRLPHKLAERIKQDHKSGLYDKRYAVAKKTLSMDTPENRFVKHAVTRSKNVLARLEQTLRKNNQDNTRAPFSDHFLDKLAAWQVPLQSMLHHTFLKDVGEFKGLSSESLVLQQKTGYSAFYRIWQELKYYLDRFEDDAAISVKSVADIYEIWCFLRIKQILEDELGFVEQQKKRGELKQNSFYEYQLKDGLAGAFEFTRVDGARARLAHEPVFSKANTSIKSYTTTQKPDIYLSVTLPAGNYFSQKQQFNWIFDAKYRIKTDSDIYDENVDINAQDYVPNDALNQMHRYRDALIHLSKKQKGLTHKSRPVIGAFALYPGFFDQTKERNYYEDGIREIGIGAFALLPGKSGALWLTQYIREQIEKRANTQAFAEQHYAQDAARIPVHGMRQVLYPDLVLISALGEKDNREPDYFERFKQGNAAWYHMPKATLSQRFGPQHIAREIRYLALTLDSDDQQTSEIQQVWPVKNVWLKPRHELTLEQTGKNSNDSSLYYLFELGSPLTLHQAIKDAPPTTVRGVLQLTRLQYLDGVTSFSQVEEVYRD